MSPTSPADLAVAFRSIHRRVERALSPVGGDSSVAPNDLAALDKVVVDAAAVLDIPADAEEVAAELTERPADAWKDGELDQLRALALRAGHLIRSIEDAASRNAGDD